MINNDSLDNDISRNNNNLNDIFRNNELKQLKKTVLEHYEGNYISYAMDKSQYLILNEENNIAKQILICFIVSAKIKSIFNIIQGISDSGKSYIYEVLFNFYIPKEYVIKMNSTTEPAFRNKSTGNSRIYDGKIVFFGDLGDNEHYEKMKYVFNIIKQVITEGEYRGEKTAKGSDSDIVSYCVQGILGAFYCDISNAEDDDDCYQLSSRGLVSTPAINSKKAKIDFQKKINTKVTHEHYLYKMAIKDLKGFKKYYASRVEYYRKNKDNIEVINPFFDLFDDISEHRTTETRELFIIDDLFKAYCILNEDCCFRYIKQVHYADETKEITILLPRKEAVQDFINIIYSGVGLKPQERNLLLKLKKELDFFSEDDASSAYEGYYEEISESESYPKHEWISNKAFDLLFEYHGVDVDNGKVFFRSSDISRKYRNSNEIKRISQDLANILRDLEKRGFLKKFEDKYHGTNVYYLNEEIICNIQSEYIINSGDSINAINYIEKNYKEDTTTVDGNGLFTDDEIDEIKRNYESIN